MNVLAGWPAANRPHGRAAASTRIRNRFLERIDLDGQKCKRGLFLIGHACGLKDALNESTPVQIHYWPEMGGIGLVREQILYRYGNEWNWLTATQKSATEEAADEVGKRKGDWLKDFRPKPARNSRHS